MGGLQKLFMLSSSPRLMSVAAGEMVVVVVEEEEAATWERARRATMKYFEIIFSLLLKTSCL